MQELSPQEKKSLAVERMRGALTADVCERLEAVDHRLLLYLTDLRDQSEGDADRHNYYEVLGGLKFLRLFDRYEFDTKKVRQVIRLGEGQWRQDANGRWRHVKGGIKQPGTVSPQVYRWEPFQVFVFANVFGFRAWFDTGDLDGMRDLLPSERVAPDGHIYDLRRLCNRFTFYSPRKVNKTGLSAFIQVVFFLMEDNDSEIYCTANAADQSRILYDRTRMMLRQLDDGHRMRMTATVCDWRPAFQNVRQSSIRPLTAGGKTKDGLKAQLCSADEYGSSPWIKDKSDMKSLVDVVESSMGPRREPLTFITTTAGTIQSGPFIEILNSLHTLLEGEI